MARERPADVEPLLDPDTAGETEGPPDPIREQITRDLEENVLLQYAFSKASRLSRAGSSSEAAAEYAKLGGCDGRQAGI